MNRGPAKQSAAHVVPAVTIATEAWGGGDAARVPDWVMIMAETCDASSRAKVASRLGYSPGVVSQVLNGTYRGDLNRVAGVIRGALLAETVMCPVVDEIARDVCLENQKRTPPFTSAMRARLYRACRDGCPHYRGKP